MKEKKKKKIKQKTKKQVKNGSCLIFFLSSPFFFRNRYFGDVGRQKHCFFVLVSAVFCKAAFFRENKGLLYGWF